MPSPRLEKILLCCPVLTDRNSLYLDLVRRNALVLPSRPFAREVLRRSLLLMETELLRLL